MASAGPTHRTHPFVATNTMGMRGGISTPFVVHWPVGIPQSQRGGVIHDPTHLIDVMPTFLQAAKGGYPSEFSGHEIQPMEGESLVPAFSGQSIQRDGPVGFEHHGNLALRDGRWKIVSAYRRDQPTRWELFDMNTDRTELNDLAETNPEKLKEMVGKWQAWADRVGVQPWPFKNKPAK